MTKKKEIPQPGPEDETAFAGPITPPQIPMGGLELRLKEMMGDYDDNKSRQEKGRKMGMQKVALLSKDK